MLWRILAVWFIADAAIVASLISGSQIATRLYSAAAEMQPIPVRLAGGRARRAGSLYAFLASLIDLAIFLPYGQTVVKIVFVSTVLILGPVCRFTATMGFNKTLWQLRREESVTESTPGPF